MVNQNDTWQIVFRIHPEKSLFYYIDGMLWQPVKKIEFNPIRKEIVYNMEVENDNSYTANNMGVHNCQDFSIAGKRAGLDGDRSSLIREIFRLLEEQEEQDRPEWLIYENVKGMLSSNRGLDYLSILSELDRLGYDIEWQNINSKWFVPQNRERIYTIGHLRRYGRRKILPVEGTDEKNSIQQLANYMPTSTRDNPNQGRVYNLGGIAPCLNKMDGGGREPSVVVPCFINMNKGAGIKLTDTSSKTRGKAERIGHAATLDHNCNQGVIGGIYTNVSPEYQRGICEGLARGLKANKHDSAVALNVTGELQKQGDGIYVELPQGVTVYAVWDEKYQCYITIRRLTPKECFRLQGWTDDYFERAAFVNSDSQLYKQAGNGVTVDVVNAIGKQIYLSE